MIDAVQNELVSVVIPTLNREERLLRTLKTIRRQTYQNLEIIISDDGCSDNTKEKVIGLGDERIVVISHPEPSGVANARNRGIKKAKGQWIAFCDDDDFWVSTKIADQMKAAKASQARWSFCSAVNINDQFIAYGHKIYNLSKQEIGLLTRVNKIPGGCSNVIAERSLVEEVGGFEPALKIYADWDLWLRFAAKGDPAVVLDYGVLYLLHDHQMTSNGTELIKELDVFRAKHGHDYSSTVDPMLAWLVGKAFTGRDVRSLISIVTRRPVLKHLALIFNVINTGIEDRSFTPFKPSADMNAAIQNVRKTLGDI